MSKKINCWGYKIKEKKWIKFNEYKIVRRNIRASKEVIKRDIVYLKVWLKKKEEMEKSYSKLTKIYRSYVNQNKGGLL